MTSEQATVIMPTYHHAEYLRSSILSVLNSNVQVRLIVVPVKEDKQSLDLLLHLYEMLNGFDRELTVIPSEKADVFHQMQLGLDDVKTEYFTVFGSDDYMLPNMIQSMLSHVNGAENPIIGLSYAITDANLTIQSNHILKPFDMNKMMKGSCIPDISLVSTEHAKLVGGLKGERDWGYLNHYAFYHRLLKLGNAEVKLRPEIGFLYRQLKGSRHSQRYKTRQDIRIHREKMKMIAEYYWRK
jgi:glycosyltransferase involved in cell wall biosynthesis